MTIQALPETFALEKASAIEGISIALHEAIEPLEMLWRSLEQGEHQSLHQSYDWCRTWLKTNPETPLVIEGRKDGKPLFLLPLAISRQGGNRVARFMATGYSNINTGLFSEGVVGLLDPADVLNALKSALRGRIDLVSLENMPLVWRNRPSPFALMPHTENHNRAFQMPLLATFEDTLKQVNAKRRRKKFRLQQRKLEEAGGYVIHHAATGAEKHALLTEFFRQKAERFRSHGLPDVFREPNVQSFFHGLLDLEKSESFAPLELYGLRLQTGETEGVPLAIAGVSRKGDHVICQFGSIRDDLLADASPGEFLFWHVIEASCNAGASLFDFGIGDQPYKRSWCTVETVQYDILLPITLKGAVAAGFHRAKVRVKALIKASPALYGMIQRWRARSSPASTSVSGEEE